MNANEGNATVGCNEDKSFMSPCFFIYWHFNTTCVL